jgi:predicted metal-dependent hydrolase
MRIRIVSQRQAWHVTDLSQEVKMWRRVLGRRNPFRALRIELENARSKIDGLVAERDAYLRQRDEALGERNEYLRQRDEALGERSEFLRQRDEALGERNEFLRQRDEALGQRNEYLRQRDEALGERNEYLRQRDEAIGECNEILHQRDTAVVERNRLLQGVREGQAAPGAASEGGNPAVSRESPTEPLRSPQNTVFVTTLPKSGTEFISGGIRDATQLVAPFEETDQASIRMYLSGYYNRDDLVSTGVFTSERLILSQVRPYLPNGYVLASHAAATYHNIRVLQDAGCNRVTVLVRDPCDSTVSWTHHIRALGPSMRNFNSLVQYLPADYFEWPHARQLAFQIRTFLPAAVNWIESWLGVVAQGDGGLDAQIVYFDEIRHHPRAMFERIFEFHGVTSYDLAKIQPPRAGVRHFRRGEHDSWREEFSEADRAFADDLINDRLMRAFDRAAACHPALQLAAAAEGGNDPAGAARHFLSLLRQFGAYRPAWEGLARAFSLLGVVDMPIANAPNPFVVPAAALTKAEQQLQPSAAHMAHLRGLSA